MASSQTEGRFEAIAGFVEHDYMLSGNTQSGHGVVFGSFEGQKVAIKPFQKKEKQPNANYSRALHEERMYKVASSLGYQTLQPLKVVKGDAVAFLITEQRGRLAQLSGLDIAKACLGEQHIVRDYAQISANLHNDYLTHGDLKLRNVALDRLFPSELVVVDLERAQIHREKNSKAEDGFQRACLNDISSASYNLGLSGYGALREDPVELYADTFFHPYINESMKVKLRPSFVDRAFSSFENGLSEYVAQSVFEG